MIADDVRNIFNRYIKQIFTALLFGKWLTQGYFPIIYCKAAILDFLPKYPKIYFFTAKINFFFIF